ncbi:hypothetical protein [Microbacterium sp. MM2322]|uniref:hypothetical protein n=1 Tax=Microbacterium sp. MM2322 TaxID=3157631 RepID=UPI0032D5A8C8
MVHHEEEFVVDTRVEDKVGRPARVRQNVRHLKFESPRVGPARRVLNGDQLTPRGVDPIVQVVANALTALGPDDSDSVVSRRQLRQLVLCARTATVDEQQLPGGVGLLNDGPYSGGKSARSARSDHENYRDKGTIGHRGLRRRVQTVERRLAFVSEPYLLETEAPVRLVELIQQPREGAAESGVTHRERVNKPEPAPFLRARKKLMRSLHVIELQGAFDDAMTRRFGCGSSSKNAVRNEAHHRALCLLVHVALVQHLGHREEPIQGDLVEHGFTRLNVRGVRKQQCTQGVPGVSLSCQPPGQRIERPS